MFVCGILSGTKEILEFLAYRLSAKTNVITHRQKVEVRARGVDYP